MKIKKYMVFVAFASIIFMIGANSVSAGNAIIWDSMVKEPKQDIINFQDSKSWANRANWVQVQYGTIGLHTFTGVPILDNGNFWVFMQNSDYEAPIIYGNLLNKPANQYSSTEMPGENGLMYGQVQYPDGSWVLNYYPDPNGIKIIKNQADEIIIKADQNQYKSGKNVVQFRLKANAGWVEEKPMTTGTYRFGIHSGSRGFSVSPSSNEANTDYVVDAKQPDGWYNMPNMYGIYGLDRQKYPIMLIPKNMADGKVTQRILTEPQPYVLPAKKYLWEIDIEKTCMGCLNDVSYVGIVNAQNSFMYSRPNATISSGSSYNAGIVPISGKWKVIGRVNGVYYTQIRDVQSGNSLSFVSPLSGNLEAIVMYLYDRNSQTPFYINTPQDIYRSIINPTSIPTPIITVIPTPTSTPVSQPTPTPTPIAPINFNDPLSPLITYISQILQILFKS